MKTMRIKQPLCALSLALLMAAPFTACSSDEANEPQPNTGKIVLNPQLGAKAWDDAAATRAGDTLKIELAAGGQLRVELYATKIGDSGGLVQDGSTMRQQNTFKIDDSGKLVRLIDIIDKEETEKDLYVPKPGKYMIAATGMMNFTDENSIPFKGYIRSTEYNYEGREKVTNIVEIADEGKLAIATKIISAGIRLNLADPDGTAYTGGEVEVSCPLTSLDDEESSKETKTLSSTTPKGIWGYMKPATIADGTELFTITETAAGGKTYKLKFSGTSGLELKPGMLYTFKARVGGTELILDATNTTIKDFEDVGKIDAALERDKTVIP